MQLSLNNVLPTPLSDRLQGRTSGIWLSDPVFGTEQYVFVKAPSGTGKTTLVHMLYGLRNDYTGSIKWDNIVLNTLSSSVLADLRTQSISIIFQDMRLFPELTAWENIEIKRQLTNTITTNEVEEWIDRLGMTDRRNAKAATLSYGEQQRIAIIRALVQPFKWLLMDEPFSHLDNANKNKAAQLVMQVVQRNKASLLLADLDDNSYFPYTQTITL